MPSTAVSRVQKLFPNVTKVVDAKTSILVSVTKRDVSGARRKDPGSCALAKACIRDQKADGALINLSYSYIIRGNVATRYKTSVTVGREITSFDRHSDFATGTNYRLSRVAKGSRLGSRSSRSGPHNPRAKRKAPPVAVHQPTHNTVRVRRLKG